MRNTIVGALAGLMLCCGGPASDSGAPDAGSGIEIASERWSDPVHGKQLEKGMTEDEVVNLLGPPHAKVGLKCGYFVLSSISDVRYNCMGYMYFVDAFLDGTSTTAKAELGVVFTKHQIPVIDMQTEWTVDHWKFF